MTKQAELFDAGERLLPATVSKLRKFPTPDVPGTGPAGETCATCRHLSRNGNSEGRGSKHFKCWLMRHRWTHGAATDVRASSPPNLLRNATAGDLQIIADEWDDLGDEAMAKRFRAMAQFKEHVPKQFSASQLEVGRG